ncbi:uncharacterized protein LAJ45_07758 [Morchella importuna]|uniref:uncharacterized protein n=1 Tax=Morchella importuna TaxID=1174673 RepID=UPI001E8DBB97|nr:uncharacterized protein LAJ45_07758 [Morchella importuna]KAH8148305.1 hypothetical protein LAJ45_07758 [Morchella importuna]
MCIDMRGVIPGSYVSGGISSGQRIMSAHPRSKHVPTASVTALPPTLTTLHLAPLLSSAISIDYLLSYTHGSPTSSSLDLELTSLLQEDFTVSAIYTDPILLQYARIRQHQTPVEEEYIWNYYADSAERNDRGRSTQIVSYNDIKDQAVLRVITYAAGAPGE